ncbi:hypothetical protein [Singulisphaera acidiphila]|uniref:Toprim domain-containing protein n=1 Tax=Singulisphaera acidiphila (strain ATCC BAA-1392 / DSM 18658 / VKM B-2454 / MOB10) TaxID=886293 RepID=L0DBJ0_SINAD|nr:hypothetical protein [Singulisphaera acidiphila]AGA26016.1 hypothetical protein Sinac_1638 [Singulisphaera acidiphila DSM 18658]
MSSQYTLPGTHEQGVAPPKSTKSQWYPSLQSATRSILRRIRRQTRDDSWAVTRGYVYRDAAGTPIYVVLRLGNRAGAKSYRPLHRANYGWHDCDPVGLLPLYNLPILATSRHIYIVEGEKCADTVADLGYQSTTSAHGAHAAGRSDWSPLAGRDVVILPDADTAGEHYMASVIRLLGQLDPVPRVRIIRMADLVVGDVPPGSDVADLVSRIWETGQDLSGFARHLQDVADSAPIVDLDGPQVDLLWRPSVAGDCQAKGVAGSQSSRYQHSYRRKSTGKRRDIFGEVLQYLEKINASVQHDDGSSNLWKVAYYCGPGYDIPEETFVNILLRYWNPYCSPPWSVWEIRRTVARAYERQTRRGWRL